MSLAFGLPMALWALAALALPLLLHLVRRERQQRTVFAALAWLSPRQRPRRRLRFERWLLLALRLALVATLALLLAQPRWLDAPGPARMSLWHPALAPPSGPADEGEERRWLAPGLPSTDTPAPATTAGFASLLREADATLPPGTALAVHVPAVVDGLDAEPLRLSRPVDWRVEAAATTAPEHAATRAATAPTLVLRGDPEHASRRWLRALQAAWSAPKGDAEHDTDPPARDAWFAWTSDAPVDAALLDRASDGGTLLLDAAAPWPLPRTPAPLDGNGWLQGAAHGSGRVLQWRVALAPETLPALLEPDFPARLRAILDPLPAPARARSDTIAPTVGATAPVPPPRPLDPPLLWLAALLFAFERLLSLRAPRPEAA